MTEIYKNDFTEIFQVDGWSEDAKTIATPSGKRILKLAEQTKYWMGRIGNQ